jgi:hypothetical protein
LAVKCLKVYIFAAFFSSFPQEPLFLGRRPAHCAESVLCLPKGGPIWGNCLFFFSRVYRSVPDCARSGRVMLKSASHDQPSVPHGRPGLTRARPTDFRGQLNRRLKTRCSVMARFGRLVGSTLVIVLVRLKCALCGERFRRAHRRGRRRSFCFDCEPPGWEIVRLPSGRTKLRRRPAAELASKPAA